MNTPVKLLETRNLHSTPQNHSSLESVEQSSVSLGVFKGLIDGILILTEQGEWIAANPRAEQICQQLLPGMYPSTLVPEEILQVCKSFSEKYVLDSKTGIFIESELSTDKLVKCRLRVQWLRLEEQQQTYLVVIIEDRYNFLQTQVALEAHTYNLTSRETEVLLLRKANYTYQEIADSLCITLDTVKKHLKNIYAKQKASLNLEK